MGVFDLIRRFFSNRDYDIPRDDPRQVPHDLSLEVRYPPALSVATLAERLGIAEGRLRNIEPNYNTFSIPKRSGGTRRIHAPSRELKAAQRRILRRLLARLNAHPTVCGFERGQSTVTHALLHAQQAVVVRLDIKNFFTSTDASHVAKYFRQIGWNREAIRLITVLCTHDGALPQGAPTSPRLSNLINYRMDARLAGLAQNQGAWYSRYADDLTFSFAEDSGERIHTVIRGAHRIAEQHGYEIHQRRKRHIRRRHQQQLVTGLVVNQTVRLPRHIRRWLRAVEHHRRTGKPTTLSDSQWQGWQAYAAMVERQSGATPQ
ncbi:MAG: hypothetical protein CMJ49_04575 [Planctomycetaceae bacterium]|nr:hypothetical protein [Planctomycetaceae bacterium]